MTLHTYNDVQQRSPEWYELRCGVITASAVGQLITPTLKVANNDTSRGLAMLLAAERISGHAEDGYVNADMMRGIEHEPIARDKYAAHNKVEVVECGFMVLERDNWRLGYSPDGLVDDDGLLEIKCPRGKEHVRTILADQVPARYVAQCQSALLVSGRDWLDFVSFHSGLPLYTKRVHPDPAWHAVIVEAVAAFEKAAEQLVSDYLAAVDGLPMTERITEMEGSSW